MSEAMTTERVVEAYWQMKGYWTRVRHPFQTNSGGWTDIDVVGLDSSGKHLIIAESKVRGPKKDLYVYSDYTRKEYGSILNFDNENYFTFLADIKPFLKSELMKGLLPSIKKVTVQLVSNYYVTESVKGKVISEIEKRIKSIFPKTIKIDFRIDTTFDIICELIEIENKNPQGRRYGHPVIDVVRELNRYMHPNVKYAGRARQDSNQIKAALREQLSKAVGIKEK